MNNPKQILSPYEQFFMPFFNYRASKNIKDANKKITRILTSLKLTPSRPIIDNLNDRTRFSYFEPVTSVKKTKYFIKIKLFEDAYINNYFFKNKVLGDALRSDPSQKLHYYTPALIEGTNDYLLYEYVEGKNYGNRYNYQPSYINTGDLPKLFQIIDAINDFPISLLPKEYEIHGWPYMMFHLYKEGRIIQMKNEYTKLFTSQEYSYISSLYYNRKLKDILHKNTDHLSHDDFQPTNFINRNTFIQLVDWDNSGIDHKFYDLVKLYTVHYRKRNVQKLIFNYSLNYQVKNNEDKIIFLSSLIARSIVECTSLMLQNKKDIHDKKKITKLKQEILKNRINDVKYWITMLIPLL